MDSSVFKALSDANRLAVVRMLSGGELCACDLLRELDITQPTLSHHMSVLVGCGLVKTRRSGTWSYYSINKGAARELASFFSQLADADDAPRRCEGCCSCDKH